jgi:hypothetical protein
MYKSSVVGLDKSILMIFICYFVNVISRTVGKKVNPTFESLLDLIYIYEHENCYDSSKKVKRDYNLMTCERYCKIKQMIQCLSR